MQQITRRESAAQIVLGNLDVLDNIAAALQSNNAIGIASAINAMFWLGQLLLFTVLWWYFDLDSTWQWSGPIANLIMPTLPFAGPVAVFALRLIFTFGPSAIQAKYYRLTEFNALLSKPTFWGTVAFDAMTDAPRVYAFTLIFVSDPFALVWYLFALYCAAFFVLLLLATIGLQQAVAMALVSFIQSLRQIWR